MLGFRGSGCGCWLRVSRFWVSGFGMRVWGYDLDCLPGNRRPWARYTTCVPGASLVTLPSRIQGNENPVLHRVEGNLFHTPFFPTEFGFGVWGLEFGGLGFRESGAWDSSLRDWGLYYGLGERRARGWGRAQCVGLCLGLSLGLCLCAGLG